MSKHCKLSQTLVLKTKRNLILVNISYFLRFFRHGAAELQLRAAVPSLAALVADPNGAVRDAAVQLLVDVYRHVGEWTIVVLLNF